MGGYLDRTYDGLLGPTPYRAYLPHGIVGCRRRQDRCHSRQTAAAPLHAMVPEPL